LIAVAPRARTVIQKAGEHTSRAEVVDLICGDLATRESIAGNGEGIGDDGVDTIARTSSSFGAEVPGYQFTRLSL
jgi:hypothetical protein